MTQHEVFCTINGESVHVETLIHHLTEQVREQALTIAVLRSQNAHLGSLLMARVTDGAPAPDRGATEPTEANPRVPAVGSDPAGDPWEPL